MSTMLSDKIRVNIFGREYEIDPGGLTPLEASQLAAYVDAKMREISDKLHIADTQKVAVLASLNIAFEMSQQRPAEDVMSERAIAKIQGMMESLDKALE
jgi:cell division protein ZapA (FtsZ GTPase activity inhibitor)